jgi:hypothetical protein
METEVIHGDSQNRISPRYPTQDEARKMIRENRVLGALFVANTLIWSFWIFFK